MSKRIQQIDIPAFASVMLAAIFLGFITHELFHLLVISNPSSLTIWFGKVSHSVTVCCLDPMESAFEEIAYLVQLIVTFVWVVINHKTYIR